MRRQQGVRMAFSDATVMTAQIGVTLQPPLANQPLVSSETGQQDEAKPQADARGGNTDSIQQRNAHLCPLSDFTPALQIIRPVLLEYVSDVHADETQGGELSDKLSLSRGGAGWRLPSGLSSKKTTSLLARDHKMDN
ncbi:unnamed protein product [Pleuronectes platessa]|uniref:Uncharacterized protein n=1 Tax=Pleuronectes platessa TaxID=8262 RepID=A0A9N7VN63_PLEPL|nr:unnamed protein product [Pleuronectes platessa]